MRKPLISADNFNETKMPSNILNIDKEEKVDNNELKLIQDNSSIKEDVNFEIYPNPNSGNFSINYFKANKNIRVIVRDMLGKIVYQNSQFQGGSMNIDISNSPKGVYSVIVGDNINTEVRKIIIN